ncbi:MAG TPA: ATPase, T2SS/T4P/T4SS family, partial [Steroidobacteraceae bacterium]
MSADPSATGTSAITGTMSAPHTPRRVDEYLREVLVRNGSDLHFVAGDPPRIRLYGDLQSLREEKLGQDQVRDSMFEIMTRQAMQRFEQKDGADFAYTIPGVSRFRVNVFRHIGGVGGVFRAIPSKALTLDQLNMPQVVRSLCRVNSGLILVTGKTGSGKSTSLAAMIDDINSRVKGHIVTIEDPIEF